MSENKPFRMIPHFKVPLTFRMLPIGTSTACLIMGDASVGVRQQCVHYVRAYNVVSAFAYGVSYVINPALCFAVSRGLLSANDETIHVNYKEDGDVKGVRLIDPDEATLGKLLDFLGYSYSLAYDFDKNGQTIKERGVGVIYPKQISDKDVNFDWVTPRKEHKHGQMLLLLLLGGGAHRPLGVQAHETWITQGFYDDEENSWVILTETGELINVKSNNTIDVLRCSELSLQQLNG